MLKMQMRMQMRMRVRAGGSKCGRLNVGVRDGPA